MVTVFVVLLDVCFFMSLRRPECRLGCLVNLVVLSLLVVRSLGQVRSPPMGESAPVKVMSGSMGPSTTIWSAAYASSLLAIPVCDFTLTMFILYYSVSLV